MRIISFGAFAAVSVAFATFAATPVHARLGSGKHSDLIGTRDLEGVDYQEIFGQGTYTPEEDTDSRSLSMMLNYSPLVCNTEAVPGITSADCLANAVPLSTLVASAVSAGSSVTVPCGTCATVDYADGSVVTLPGDGALNVLGRLHFPSSADVTLNVTSVVVEGHLDIGIPDVGKKVKVTLYGTDTKYYYPHGLCCVTGTCDSECTHKKSIGKKPVVVAGGTIDIRAVDPDCPSWTTLKSVEKIPDPDGGAADVTKNFVVDPAFARCIRPGDSLLTTSSLSGAWNGHHPWTADSVVDADAGIVAMVGHDMYNHPTEAGPGEPVYAAEVANLRRDVWFEGQKDDPDDKHGAHFMIFHTSDVVQTIEGGGFDNFGQGGNIGRYPIHFHMCGNTGSRVAKNVITNSNQRCIVIHDTNEVNVIDNVSYKTRGHCYVTETGSEVNNTFEKNLGVETRTLGADNGQSDSEGSGKPHQNEPSTFWIRNAQNHFIGNVAAGAQLNGWWFEMDRDKTSPLYTFKGNVAHSCKQGLITYPGGGWFPSNDAVFENFRSYKNNGDGFKFVFSGGFTLNNSLIADNGIGIKEFFSAGVIRYENTEFVGRSEDYKLRFGYTTNTITNPGHRIDYNSYHRSAYRNVTFSEFRNGKKAIAPYFEGRFGGARSMGQPLSTVEVTFDDTVVDAGRDPLPTDAAWTMYMEDVNGTMGPEGKGPGFFVEDTARLTAFVPPEQCSSISSNTKFCEDVCLRHVQFYPSNYVGGTYKKLVLSDGTTTFEYSSANSYTGKHFDVLLPPGEYSGVFKDADDNDMFPQSVAIDERNPPVREGCSYVTSSSFSFDIVDPPEVQLYNYGNSLGYQRVTPWLFANAESFGAREDEEPVDETVWKVEGIDCPSTSQGFVRPTGVACYQIIGGGGSSRQRLWAQTNKVWTQKVGVRSSIDVGTDERWYFEKATCDTTDARECFYIINAQSGRRLYRSANKWDLGGTPPAQINTSNSCKWYMTAYGTTDSQLPSIDIITTAPTKAPTAAPTTTPAPTPTPTPLVRLVNFGASDNVLWAKEQTGAWGGVGAKKSTTAAEDTTWALEQVACPASPWYTIPGDTCYIIVGGGASRRRLLAQGNPQFVSGVGADPSATVWDDHKWKLVDAECDPSDSRQCVFLVNALSGRRLYKTLGTGQFGATPKGIVNTHDDCKWYIETLGSTSLDTLVIGPADAPIPEVNLINYGAPDASLWATEQTGPWGGVGAKESTTAAEDTTWALQEVACPTNPWYSIPGSTCYTVSGGGVYRRRILAQGNSPWTHGIGADPRATIYDDSKWKLVSAECDSLDARTCVYIVNAQNGRRLFKNTETNQFGGTLKGVVNTDDECKWYLGNLGSSTLDIAPDTPIMPPVHFINYETGKALWAEVKNYAWGGFNADPNPSALNPNLDATWFRSDVACPAAPLYPDLGLGQSSCLTLNSGGVFRRRIFAQSNPSWTGGIGADPNSKIWDDQKWYLVDAECDPSVSMPCFFIVNAHNGRRLYKLNKGDFGASPKGTGAQLAYTSDDAYKWYMKEIANASEASATHSYRVKNRGDLTGLANSVYVSTVSHNYGSANVGSHGGDTWYNFWGAYTANGDFTMTFAKDVTAKFVVANNYAPTTCWVGVLVNGIEEGRTYQKTPALGGAWDEISVDVIAGDTVKITETETCITAIHSIEISPPGTFPESANNDPEPESYSITNQGDLTGLINSVYITTVHQNYQESQTVSYGGDTWFKFWGSGSADGDVSIIFAQNATAKFDVANGYDPETCWVGVFVNGDEKGGTYQKTPALGGAWDEISVDVVAGDTVKISETEICITAIKLIQISPPNAE